MLQPASLVSDKRPLFSLFTIFVNFFLGFVLIGPVIGFGVASLVYDGNLLEDLFLPSTASGIFYPLLIAQGITALIGLVILPILHIRVLEQKSLFAFFKPDSTLNFLLVAILGFNFLIAISPITEWNADVHFPDFLKGFEDWARTQEDRNGELTTAMTSFNSVGDMLLGLLVVALVPAVGEELVFRGMIQNEIWRGMRNPHVAIFTTAFLFSAIHVQFFGFIPRFLLGTLFGYLYYWSGNLLIPMFAHFFNNGFSVIAVYLHQHGKISMDPETTESMPWQAVIPSAVIVVVLLVYLKRIFDARQINQEGTTPLL